MQIWRSPNRALEGWRMQDGFAGLWGAACNAHVDQLLEPSSGYDYFHKAPRSTARQSRQLPGCHVD